MMHHKPNLTKKQAANLEKLAEYLCSGNLKADFDMGAYSQEVTEDQDRVFCEAAKRGDSWTKNLHDAQDALTECGTVGCAAGHGPYAGVIKRMDEDWPDYIQRAFGVCTANKFWAWCFSGFWREKDNTPKGAGTRIKYMLDFGVPDNAEKQLTDPDTPLSYLPKEDTEPYDGQTSGLKALKSAAGWYIGQLYYDAEVGNWLPYSRNSERYWGTKEQAEAALLSDDYIKRTEI